MISLPARSLDRATYLGLLATVLAAPFELLTPVVRVAGLAITNVEVIALIAVGAGALSFIARRPDLNADLAIPATCWIIVLLASSFVAEDRAAALKFTGRSTLGLALMLLTMSTLRARRQYRQLLSVACFSGSIVAILALLDLFRWFEIDGLLAYFRPSDFSVRGLTRASSTLQYPTIAAMYLEIVFGLGLGLLLARTRHRSCRLATLAMLWLTAAGVMATGTRGGLVTLFVMLSVSALLARRRLGNGKPLRLISGLTAMITVTLLLFLWSSPAYRLRVSTESPRNWYRAAFEAPERIDLVAGERATIDLRVHNRGQADWSSTGSNPIFLSYHWHHPRLNRRLDLGEGARTSLGEKLSAGDSRSISARVQAPNREGEFRINWDMVFEHRFWFGEHEDLTTFTLVNVRQAPAGPRSPYSPPAFLPPLSSESRYQLSREQLWRAAALVVRDRPLLGAGADNFRLVYGRYLDLDPWNHTLHANNLYLEIAATTGFIGLAFFVWLALRLVGLLRAEWRRITGSSFPFFVSGATVVAAVAVHGLVDYFLTFTPTYVMIWVSLGLVGALRRIAD